MDTAHKTVMDRVNTFLDRYVLPWPVRFLTFRVVILITIGLLVPLILFAKNTVMVLGVNSYLNTMSVAVSSIVLLYTTVAEARQKQIAQMHEQRAQEDHQHVVAMHALTIQALQNQQDELAELRRVVAQFAGCDAGTVERPEPPDLQALHPRGHERFTDEDLERRWQASVHHNALVSAIREDLAAGGDDA
jgi:hypothetical protein